MKWSIIFLNVVLGVVAIHADSAARKIDWTKLQHREIFPSNAPLGWKASLARASEGRIIGGEVAPKGKFPHQVALIIDYFGFCGGSLLNNLYVLTAAHCTYRSYEIDVYLGSHDISLDEEEGREVITVPWENFIIHQAYNEASIQNDISLIMLTKRITFTDNIKPIRLPTRTEAKVNLENVHVMASGWGRPSDSSSSISPLLRHAQLRVQPKVICKHFFGGLVLESNVCTDTGRGQGTCSGDSGGPLMYEKTPGDAYIIGLTSFGSSISCVESGWPSVFTFVPSYLTWIRDNTDIIIQE